MKPIRTPLFLLALCSIFLVSCGASTETAATLHLDAVAAGPFFSGPNSLIAEYQVDLASIAGLEQVSKEQIQEVSIQSIRMSLDPSAELDMTAFSSASMQLVSADVDMITIGLKNPIAAKGQELAFDVSQEADIAAYLKGDKLSLVLDLDFIEDDYADELGAKVVMQISVKHN